MQRVVKSRWHPLELCCWSELTVLPAKGKEYAELSYKWLMTAALAPLEVPAEQHHPQGEECGAEEDLFIGDGEFADGDEESIDIVNDGSDLDEDTKRFDTIIGALEDILMDPAFEDARETFCRANCSHFETFFMMLDEKKDELMSDVFDLLLSLGDFEAFRELMLSYKRDAAGSSQGLQVQCCAMKIHTEEQEDGEERPDLDLGLTISPVGTRPNRF
ncbi:hypothetical protein QJQ45_022071 [Haematococcus lacustris]|nr:hypothetical protein QJQ45_022071 [Haematococcus lacustris]